MNRRDAKRRACRIAATAIEGVQAVELHVYYLDDDEDLSAEDLARLEAALRELGCELWRRRVRIRRAGE